MKEREGYGRQGTSQSQAEPSSFSIEKPTEDIAWRGFCRGISTDTPSIFSGWAKEGGEDLVRPLAHPYPGRFIKFRTPCALPPAYRHM